jgi:hypothetical protein
VRGPGGREVGLAVHRQPDLGLPSKDSSLNVGAGRIQLTVIRGDARRRITGPMQTPMAEQTEPNPVSGQPPRSHRLR